MKKIILSILTIIFLSLTFSVWNNFIWNITHEDQDSLIIWKLISINKDMWQIIIKSEKNISWKRINWEIKVVTKWIYFKKYAKNKFLWENVLISISERNNNYYIKRWLYQIEKENWEYIMSNDFGWDNNKILNHYINTWKHILPEYKQNDIKEKIVEEEKKVYIPQKKQTILIKKNNIKKEDPTKKSSQINNTQEPLLETQNIKKYVINILIYWLLIIILIFVSMIVFFAIKHKKENKDNTKWEEEKYGEDDNKENEQNIYANKVETSNDKNTEENLEENTKKNPEENTSENFFDQYYKIDDDDDEIIEVGTDVNHEEDVNKKLDKNPFDNPFDT
jgi:hypothetical protein